MPDQRTCPACGAALARRPREAPSAFAKRETCGRSCGSVMRWKAPAGSHRYESPNGGYVTAPVFLAELVCARQAARRGLPLPPDFAGRPEWELEFKLQLKAANKLCRAYSPAAVSRALRTPDGKRATSLRGGWF